MGVSHLWTSALEVQHLEMARVMHHPELGDVKVVNLPMQFSRHPRADGPMNPAPHQGDQTDAILKGLGYSPDQILQLREQYIV